MAVLTSKELARRLETAECFIEADYALAYNRLNQVSEGAYKKVGSGYAIFSGVDSPLTQAFALGLEGAVSAGEIEELEEFFRERGAPVNVEVCNLSDLSLAQLLAARGYKITEYTNVLARPLTSGDAVEPPLKNRVQLITEEEVEEFSRVVAEGFFEGGRAPQSFVDIFRIFFTQSSSACFGAYVDGRRAGGGAVFIMDGVAGFGGASTLPEYRGRGIQGDLLKARLSYAASKGADLAMVTTLPGTVSQRNTQKLGFQVVYSRTKFTREWQPSAERSEQA